MSKKPTYLAKINRRYFSHITRGQDKARLSRAAAEASFEVTNVLFYFQLSILPPLAHFHFHVWILSIQSYIPGKKKNKEWGRWRNSWVRKVSIFSEIFHFLPCLLPHDLTWKVVKENIILRFSAVPNKTGVLWVKKKEGTDMG